MILVYRYRVKSLNGLLNKQSRAVNFVWNFCNDRQKDALRFGRRWHTGFDLNKLTTGSSKELGLHSGTVNAVCEQYAKSRSQKKRPCLRYRGKKSLGWVPLKGRELKREGDAFRFAGNTFRVFNSRAPTRGNGDHVMTASPIKGRRRSRSAECCNLQSQAPRAQPGRTWLGIQ